MPVHDAAKGLNRQHSPSPAGTHVIVAHADLVFDETIHMLSALGFDEERAWVLTVNGEREPARKGSGARPGHVSGLPPQAIASQRVRPATPRQRGPKSHRETSPQDSRSPSQQWRQARSARRLRAKRHHEYAGIAALAPPLRRRWREGRGRQRWLAPPQPPQQQQHLKACRPGKATATTQL